MRINANFPQYDWPLFAKLTGFTEGSLKKFWPPVKNKVIEQTESFSSFLEGAGAAAPPPPKGAAEGKKRKAADADGEVADIKTKRLPAKKLGKKVKTEEGEDEKLQEGENSADGGDGLGEFVYRKIVVDWLESTDGTADEA